MMTRTQFALMAGAPPKWIDNARRLLGRAPAMTQQEARWFGLVHDLHGSLGCGLREAAAYADQVLAEHGGHRYVRLAVGDAGRVELVLDTWRDLTIHLARLSRALVRPPIERRGRPRPKPVRARVRERAAAYGVDVSRLEEGRGRTVEQRLQRLDENAEFLAAARASRTSTRSAR